MLAGFIVVLAEAPGLEIVLVTRAAGGTGAGEVRDGEVEVEVRETL